MKIYSNSYLATPNSGSMYNASRAFRIFSFSTIILIAAGCSNSNGSTEKKSADSTGGNEKNGAAQAAPAQPWTNKTVDTADYNRLVKYLANGDTTGKWPAKSPYPLPGAILPFYRIVAYYGNLSSKKMGVLGEYPKDEMIQKLKGEIKEWKAADSTLPILPALHYIAITAQGAPGKDAMYRLRMSHSQIDTVYKWSQEINGLTFLDIQVGHSKIMNEVPTLEEYLKRPTVHLGIDPEFSMKGGEVPGRRIGTYNADDINGVIDYLASLVKKYNLPPKILMVHRFTEGMVRNYENIKKVPEVQVIIDMDGWGDKTLKRSSYLLYVHNNPVEFAGFKLFYKNDIRKDPNGMLTKQEVMALKPQPIYIQYQ
jgi:hypothetical protein